MIYDFRASAVAVTDAAGTAKGIRLAWTPVPEHIRDYRVTISYRLSGAQWSTAHVVRGATSHVLAPLEPGAYEFQAAWQRPGGVVQRKGLLFHFDPLAVTPDTPLPRPTGLELVGQSGVLLGSSREWVGRDIKLRWNRLRPNVADTDRVDVAPLDGLVSDQILRVVDPDNPSVVIREEILPAEATYWVYAFATHQEDGLRRRVRLELRTRDRAGRLSESAPITVANASPLAPGPVDEDGSPAVLDPVTASQGVERIQLRVGLPAVLDPDIVGLLVWYSTVDSPTFDPNNLTNLLADVPLQGVQLAELPYVEVSPLFPLADFKGQTLYFKAAYYDTFTKQAALLNYTPTSASLAVVATATRVSVDGSGSGLQADTLNDALTEIVVGESTTISAQSSVDFNGKITGACRIDINLTVSSDGVSLLARTDSDGGASYDSGASDYGYVTEQTSPHSVSAIFENDAAANLMRLTQSGASGIGNAAGEFIRGWIEVRDVGGSSRRPYLRWDLQLYDIGSRLLHVTGAGTRNSGATINSLRLYVASGTVSGTVRKRPIP